MTTRDPMAGPGPLLLPYDGVVPSVAADAFVADGVTLVGAVTLDAESSVWFGAVIRADGAPIRIGAGSNVQDGCVVHSDPSYPVVVGDRVTIGHRAVVHGCTIGNDTLIGMGAVVLNGAVVGCGTLVAAGTVVLEGTVVPPGSLVAGVPGRVKRPCTEAERGRMRSGAESYVTRARAYRAGRAS